MGMVLHEDKNALCNGDLKIYPIRIALTISGKSVNKIKSYYLIKIVSLFYNLLNKINNKII